MIQDPTFHTVLYSRGWDVFELSVCSRRRGMQLSSRSRVQGGGGMTYNLTSILICPLEGGMQLSSPSIVEDKEVQ